MSKKYIGYENVTIRKLVCNHPSVTKIWEYGGYAAIPTNGEAKRYLDVMLQDGTRKEFSDNGDGSAVEKMEEYLQEIKDEQEQSSIEWKWTDELVKEFRMFIGKFSVSHDDAIPAFKKYKNGENFLWTEQSSRPFEWTDEKVIDLMMAKWPSRSMAMISLDEYKKHCLSQSILAGKGTANDVLNTEEKTSRRLAHEQIYARKRKEIGGIFHLTEKTSWITYVFFSPEEISIDKKDKIKCAIEKIINE